MVLLVQKYHKIGVLPIFFEGFSCNILCATIVSHVKAVAPAHRQATNFASKLVVLVKLQIGALCC